MNKSEIELELKALEAMLEFGAPYTNKEQVDEIIEAIAAYLRRRISTDRSWKKYSYRVEFDEDRPRIRIMQSQNSKGEVYI